MNNNDSFEFTDNDMDLLLHAVGELERIKEKHKDARASEPGCISPPRMHAAILQENFTDEEIKHKESCDACQKAEKRFLRIIEHPSQADLAAYKNGSLTDDALRDVKVHIEKRKCRACLAALESVALDSGAMDSEPEIQLAAAETGSAPAVSAEPEIQLAAATTGSASAVSAEVGEFTYGMACAPEEADSVSVDLFDENSEISLQLREVDNGLLAVVSTDRPDLGERRVIVKLISPTTESADATTEEPIDAETVELKATNDGCKGRCTFSKRPEGQFHVGFALLSLDEMRDKGKKS